METDGRYIKEATKNMKESLELKLQKEFDFMSRIGNENLYQQYGCEYGDGWYT